MIIKHYFKGKGWLDIQNRSIIDYFSRKLKIRLTKALFHFDDRDGILGKMSYPSATVAIRSFDMIGQCVLTERNF